jgi:dTDP-4-amino-4,6-dideoxygalactose transaminase
MWYATQAREAYPYYQHEAIGYNYRMSNICAGIGRGQMTIVNEHIAHHRHIQKLYEELLKDVPGITVHSQPNNETNGTRDFDSNYWLCTILLSEELKVKGEELAYAEAVHGAVGGAAGVVHGGGTVHTDCEPNRNVEAMRLALDKAGIESRPLWKPMHKQPVYCRTSEECRLKSEELSNGVIRQTSASSVAYVNGVSEALFKQGLCLPSGPCVTDEQIAFIVDEIKKNIL